MSFRSKGQGNSASHMETQTPNDGGNDSKEKKRKTIFEPQGKFLKRWSKILLVSRVIALFLDPLFFYVPVINEDNKCIALDKRLWITAIVLRTIDDIIYLTNIVLQFRTAFKDDKHGKELNTDSKAIARRYLKTYFLFDFLAILPIPQALGACWYFFSTQRLVACWKIACENHSGCVQSSFNCDHKSVGNVSFFNDFCGPKTELFKFGIFLEAVQSGIFGSTDLPQKLSSGFWWGMRNLSSYGSNLQTSNYIWENCFALCISIFGLLLFLFFMGNLQMYMQWTTSKSINNWKKDRKHKKQEENITSWLSKEAIPKEMRNEILDHIHKKFKVDEDVCVENLIPDLPSKLQGEVKYHICFHLLKKLNSTKERDLDKPRDWDKPRQLLLDILTKDMCGSLKPVFYNEQCYILQEGDPIDAIFLITDGIVWSSNKSNNNGEGATSSSRQVECLVKGQLFGEELLDWFWNKDSSLDMSKLILPVSSKTLKTHTKVEAFALMANDLKEKASRRHDLDKKQEE